MNPETRAFLDAVRTAEDPSSDDERRVLSAVRATLVTSAALGTGISVAKASTPSAGSAAAGIKLGGLVLGLGAAALVVGAVVAVGRPGPREATGSAMPSARAHAPGVACVSPPPRPAPGAHSDAIPGIRTLPAARPSASVMQSGRPRAEVSASAAPPTPSSLREEIALLTEVQAALERRDGATALGRLDQHQTLDRRLLAERRAARILALCLLGRRQEAEQAALAFVREHPTSVQRTAVERSCAENAIVQR
jgi:hypothetical protein